MTETEERCESPSMEEAVSDLIGCIAFGCCNRCDGGFDMIKLPVDAQRKKKWLDNMKREKWDPPPDVKICEVHFTDEMWELDKKTNKRKLKNDALPTLFSCKGDNIPTVPYSQAKKCCAVDCSNREGFTSSPDVTFHSFPDKNSKAEILEKWKKATGDPLFVPTPKSYICNEHLEQEDIKFSTSDKGVRSNASSKKVKTEDLEEIDVNDPYIEIHGLDPSKHSDLNSDIRRIADFFGVKVETEHIHRSFIVKKKNKDTGHITSDMVIVKFNDLSKKRELLKAFKNSDSALIDRNKGEAIFLTGELSPANKKLLVITEKIPVGEMRSVKATSGSPSKAQESMSETSQGNIVVKKLVRNIVIEPNESQSKVTIQKKGRTTSASASAKEIVDILEDNKEEGVKSPSPSPKKVVAEKGKDNQLEQLAIKEEINDSDPPHGDISYDQLMTGVKSEGKVTLERVESDVNEEEEATAGEDTSPDRRTKPFKKRFSTENSDEVEQEEEEDDNAEEEEKPSTKKKGRKSVKSRGGTPSKDTTPQLRSSGGRVSLRSNRRQVIKPKRYREDFFDYSTPVEKKRREMSPQKKVMTPQKKESPVVKDTPVQKKEGPNQKKESPIQKRETPTTKKELIVQKKETSQVIEISRKETPLRKEVTSLKVEKTPAKREMPRRKLASPAVKKEPDEDSIDEEELVENKEVGKKKKIVKKAVDIKEVKKQTHHRKTLKVVMESESDTESCDSDIDIKKRVVGKSSTSKSAVGNTSELTPQHGVTPITVNNVVTSLSSGSMPVGLTPMNIPQALSIPPSSQANPNNFKLITNFDQLICHLKERQMLESHLETILVKNFCGQELYKLMRCKDLNPISKFSELQVKFALIMLLYSSKCFKYLDAVFALPPVTSLENLLITSDFKPGFLEESFNFLAEAYDGCGRITLRECFLAVDTIPISKKLVWDHENDTFTGGTKIFESFSYHISEATNILIVMLCSLTNVTSIPIAYFPLDTVHPDFEASIIKISLNKLYERRIKVHGIVLDASETSFACSKILGCSLITEAKIMSAHFIKNKTKIPILFDCYHLSRLARDTLAELDMISTSNGCAEWKYIHLLNERLMNKFSSNSKNSGDTLMQLKFNSSLSMALENQKNEGDMSFSCCQPTLMLIKQIDKVTSIFDYTKKHFVASNSEKALNQHKANYLSDFCPYFRTLKTENEILFKHNKYEFVKGLYFTMNSICLLYEKLRKVIVTKDIPKHRFSLDSVDLFYYYAFSRVNSDRPIDCLAFRQGLAKYVKQVTHKSIPFKEIPPLLVDFRSDKRSFRPYHQVINENKNLFYVEVLTSDNLKIFSDDILKLVCHEIIDNLSSKIMCLKCIDMLNNRNDVILPADHNDYTGSIWKKEMALIYSNRSRSLVLDECLKIIKKTEQIFNIVKLSVNIRDMALDKLCDIIVAKVKRDLYSESLNMPFSKFNHPVYEDVGTTTHELYLTRLLIENYVKFRMTKIKIFSSLISKFDTLFIIV